MSTPPEDPRGPAPARLRCPRCGADIGPEQDWCLDCGVPARTRLAPTPNWRAPIAVLAVVVLVAGGALALAFARLTRDDGTVAAATSTIAPVQPNETAAQSIPTAPPITETQPAAPSSAAPSSATPSSAAPSSATPANP